MALKETIHLWNEAVNLFVNGDLIDCLALLSKVQVSAKIRYNQGVVCCRMNRLHDALRYLDEALELDKFLAIAYFKRGLLRFSMGRYNEADQDFESTWVNLRGSLVIDYRQLGLHTKLHAAQVLYNRVVVKKSLKDDLAAQKLWTQLVEVSKDRGIFEGVDTEKNEKLVDLNPPYSLFGPPKGFVANLQKRDFLGKAEVVSSVEDPDFVQRKSHSNPSSPAGIRKNLLAEHDARTRSSRTPPPNRPPPKLKDNPHESEFKAIPRRPVPVPQSQPQSIPVPVPKRPTPVSNVVRNSPSFQNTVPQNTDKPAVSEKRRERPSRPPPPVFKS